MESRIAESWLSSAGKSLAVMLVAVCFTLSDLAPAAADPPPWAPAHGWRAKQKHKQKQKHKYKNRAYYDDRVYTAPFDLNRGVCNRQVLGGLLGGATGALIGSRLAKGDDRAAAIIGGTIIGLIVGGSIGRSMDEVDQNCVGQTLEHAPDGETIYWNNQQADTQYQVTPVKTYQVNDGRYCREYQTTSVIGGRAQQTYGTACRQPDGSWELIS
jgi:surface antigen